jgi:type III pantothenate kinase
MADLWFALSIGNSRLHWGMFEGETLQTSLDVPHLEAVPEWDAAAELWLASVVPDQSEYWKSFTNIHWIDLAQVPLRQVYATLGIDRALALWGAIVQYGAPVLVIDCGTALTFTGADANSNLIGGAILPGLKLQFEALGQSTANLPLLQAEIRPLPRRWARNTETAIQSGILHTVLSGIQSFIEDWRSQFPQSTVVLTGGDAELLNQFLQLKCDPSLSFWGIRSLRFAKQPS